MTTRRKSKLVHEGQYVAEVEIEVLDSESGWAPYLSLEDAYRLDDVHSLLRRGEIGAASKLARVFVLTPVAV